MFRRRTRKRQKFSILALFICAVTMSIGFAAFSSDLTISTNAKVNPNENDFSIVFSSSETTLSTADVTPSPSNLGTPATIVNGDNPTISNLNVTFTEPGESVIYTFYARNVGQYDAFLNSVGPTNLINSNGTQVAKLCTPVSGTTESTVAQACEGINILIKVGSLPGKPVDNFTINSLHTLAKGSSDTIKIKISYDEDATRADGDFKVQFADILINYVSYKASTSS